jgi:hypothetical protein
MGSEAENVALRVECLRALIADCDLDSPGACSSNDDCSSPYLVLGFAAEFILKRAADQAQKVLS